MKKNIFISVMVAMGLIFNVSAATAQISNTGPGSDNSIDITNECDVDVSNDNDVDGSVDVDQDADSGESSNDSNTDGGDSTSGDAGNDSDVDFDVDIDNDAENPCCVDCTNGGDNGDGNGGDDGDNGNQPTDGEDPQLQDGEVLSLPSTSGNTPLTAALLSGGAVLALAGASRFFARLR